MHERYQVILGEAGRVPTSHEREWEVCKDGDEHATSTGEMLK